MSWDYYNNKLSSGEGKIVSCWHDGMLRPHSKSLKEVPALESYSSNGMDWPHSIPTAARGGKFNIQ